MPDMNNARTQINSESHTHLNNTDEHIVQSFLPFKGSASMSLDLSLITKLLQIKIQERVDGTNYRVKSFKNFNQGRFEIDQVTDNGGKAQFRTTAAHGLDDTKTVITRDFTTITSYNVTDTVSLVPDTTHFELTNVNFDTSTDTGYVVTPQADNDFKFGQQVVSANMEGSNNDVKLTFQSPVAEGANSNIPITLRVTSPF